MKTPWGETSEEDITEGSSSITEGSPATVYVGMGGEVRQLHEHAAIVELGKELHGPPRTHGGFQQGQILALLKLSSCRTERPRRRGPIIMHCSDLQREYSSKSGAILICKLQG